MKFETQEEENLFLSIIDKFDAHESPDLDFELTDSEQQIIIKISDWFTSEVGYRE
jgi:hypothetical protein